MGTKETLNVLKFDSGCPKLPALEKSKRPCIFKLILPHFFSDYLMPEKKYLTFKHQQLKEYHTCGNYKQINDNQPISLYGCIGSLSDKVTRFTVIFM